MDKNRSRQPANRNC